MEYNALLSGLFSGFVQRHIDSVIDNQDINDLPYIITYTGKLFHHLAPGPGDICIQDIAHALSRICRFTGHVRPAHYSVAQHSVMVSDTCNPKDALWGLLHDAPEAYCSDLSSPLKYAPGMEGYRLIEKKIMQAVCAHFGLDQQEPVAVKYADRRVFTSEITDLFSSPAAEQEAAHFAKQWPRHSPLPITGWPAEMAEYYFLQRYHALTSAFIPAFHGPGFLSMIGSPSVNPSTP